MSLRSNYAPEGQTFPSVEAERLEVSVYTMLREAASSLFTAQAELNDLLAKAKVRLGIK